MKAARLVLSGLGVVLALSTAACSSSGPSDAGAVPGRLTTTTQPPTTLPAASTSSTTPPTPTSRAPASPTTTPPPRPPATTSTTDMEYEPVWTRYTSAVYRVALRYPPHWPEPDTGSAAPPHFFSVSAMSGGGQSLAETCRDAASHRLQPFGSTPAVHTNVSFAGQPGCLIEPSADQPAGQRDMGQVMVRYPTPLQLPSGRYDILVLTAHVHELPAIASTLSFTG